MKAICLIADQGTQVGNECINELSRQGFEIVRGGLQTLIDLRQKRPDAALILAVPAFGDQCDLVAIRFDCRARLSPGCANVRELVAGLQPSEESDLLGDSAAMVRLRTLISRIASGDANVLVTGESGTGKELAAARIHRLSPRRNGPFISVNCAAIPDTLLESELFGYQKGAFTGAGPGHEGKFAEADGGTLFLDEIGDLSHYAQAKVLRAIETRRIDRLGGRGDMRVDIRIIAATNRDLEQMAASGHFRQDLFFRLNVIEIHLPPLRDRAEDIPGLIRYYLREFNHRYRHSVQGVEPELLDALQNYAWPGNVRELRNLFEGVYACEDPPSTLSMGHLPCRLQERMLGVKPNEKVRLLQALMSTNWNKSRAAKSLNWSRVTLYRKMARYELSELPKTHSA
jgi:two-component system response regulator HydG/two-component system response regulator AtoC